MHGIKCFSHIMLYVADLERAVDWYCKTLGFTPNFVVPNIFASLRHDDWGCRVDLHPSEADGKDVGHGPIPYFLVDDIEATLASLKEAGVKVGPVKQEGDSPLFASIWDSESNALGLEQEVIR